MQRFIIKGGSPLAGEIEINGAKNAILPILAACLLSDGECVLENVPLLEDVFVMCEILKYYGVNIVWLGNTLIINSQDIENHSPPEDLMKKMRASNLILGPLISLFGEVCLPFPGGCAIGSRPMNYHLMAFSQMGVDIANVGPYIQATTGKLHGGKICLDFPSVGATENAIMAGVKAKGETIIYNAAKEPEIVDLANFLQKMGAKITGAGTDTIYIEGVEKLHGAEHRILDDRIEAGTMMIAAAISGGDILLSNYKETHCESVIAKLQECGVIINNDARGLRIKCCRRPKCADIRTMPYPGFPTDMQAQYMALMAISQGISIVSENIFENRFRHADEMMRMGADIKVIGDSAVIKGKRRLNGAKVKATDLRAGAALVLLALASQGESIVENVCYIDRGYQSLEKSLYSLGADIKRQSVPLEEKALMQINVCPC
ncbi:MAG: UDP-N-acetylglucosamine 1-carboxyvinyltransferase [Bacillota bacterium]|jgi:UDP-N-acetylglucosamine 1-carboxyvinyltransferase